ncbi:DNA (cytosine-5-)-methyltransferase [Afipia carboxidovorans]|uniref:DNA cytosine methyltransferase n=1 Tax=Afipia carboxidovorans TaxID=40137 RepID=UPI0030D08402
MSKGSACATARAGRSVSRGYAHKRRASHLRPAQQNNTCDIPRTKVNVLSLCSGMGSDAAAFELADIPHKLVAVSEIDPAACAVLTHKFPETPNLGNLNHANWSALHDQEIDILTAGFPCQPHSAAGHRKGLDDPRECSAGVLRAIAKVHPDWVLLENVQGFVSSSGGRAYRRLLARLRRQGYDCEAKIIDAIDVLPQRRRRVWILGHRGTSGPSPAEVFAVAASGGRCDAPRKEEPVHHAAATAQRPDIHHPLALPTLMASGSGIIKAGLRSTELGFLIVQDIEGHGTIVRRATSLEIIRAQGFPDDWLEGVMWRNKPLSRTQTAKLVGNAWPVVIPALIFAAINKLRGWKPPP